MKHQFRVTLLGLFCMLALSAVMAGCGTAAPAGPAISITSPAAGATVSGATTKIEVAVTNFNLVDANIAPKDGEGHLHFFIDVPASTVAVGQVIPLDDASKYVHAGKAPYNTRDIPLAKGKHTITVVAANAAHIALAQPAPVSVTFTVQ